MNATERQLPFNRVVLVLGTLSVPLAFMRHLVSLAVVLAVLALALAAWGRWVRGRWPDRYSMASVKRWRFGSYTACAGLACALVMWWLWATGRLF